MFNRTLRRPMFKRGGSTSGTGLMSMVEPRGMYADSNYADIIAKQKEYTDSIRSSAEPSNIEKILLLGQVASTPGSLFDKMKASIPLTSEILRRGRAAEGEAKKMELSNMIDIEKLKIAGMDKAGMTPSKIKEADYIYQQNIAALQNKLGRELTDTEKNDAKENAKAQVWPTERKTKSKEDTYSDIFKYKFEDIATQRDNIVKAIQSGDLQKYRKEVQKLQSIYSLISSVSGINPLDDPRLQIPQFGPETKRETKSDGGRIGYAMGTPDTGVEQAPSVVPVEEQAMSMAQAQSPQTQTQELKSFSFQELRTKLPQEVTDDIVRLLSNSKDALRDFAYITTQNDINEFNKKYGVNLVLPAQS